MFDIIYGIWIILKEKNIMIQISYMQGSVQLEVILLNTSFSQFISLLSKIILSAKFQEYIQN